MHRRQILRLTLPALLLLPLAHCSCQRQHADANATRTPVDAQPASDPAGARTSPSSTDPQAPAAAASRDALATLHAYLGALPGSDRRRADAYWSGGRPGNPADDSALREVPDLLGMRIDNERPRELDQASPPREFEIPVRLRLDTGSGQGRLHGWYRLRARADGQGWEITAAELDPVLD